MKIIFQAFDGRTFDTREDCFKYEERSLPVMMEGKERVFTSSNAIFIYLENHQIGEIFLEMAKNEDDVDVAGLDEYPQGCFYWDFDNRKYRRIPDEAIDSLKVLFQEGRI